MGIVWPWAKARPHKDRTTESIELQLEFVEDHLRQFVQREKNLARDRRKYGVDSWEYRFSSSNPVPLDLVRETKQVRRELLRELRIRSK